MAKKTAIVVVDDLEINRAILKELFYQECTVLEAENGEVALELLEEHPEIDIVIMDIVMPVMDGFEALQRIRATPRLANLPVVICTEHAEVNMQVRALDLGSTDFITKPFNARVVSHRVRNLIAMREMERKIAEQRRADQLRSILNSIVSPLGLFEFTGSKVRAIYLNQGIFDMFPGGQKETKRLFGNMLQSLLPEDADKLMDLIRQNRESGAPVDLTYRVPHEDGSHSLHEMHALSIRYEHFENPVYLASITDITHQRSTEVALRETDQRLKSLINAVPGAILILDLSDPVKVTFFNDTVCEILGVSRTEFQARSQDILSFVYKSDQNIVRRSMEVFLSEPNPFSETFRVEHKDNDVRWVRLSAAPIVTVEGSLLCNCVCIDVTAEKKSELELAQAFKEMRYRSEHDALTGMWNRETFNEKTHKLLVDSIDVPYALLVLNIQRFKLVNELFGTLVGDMVLRTLSRALVEMFSALGTCGRMEADTFMACLPVSHLHMDPIVEKLDQIMKEQYSDYRIELYYGVYDVNDVQMPVDQMCDRAAMALKTVKGSAIKRFAVYDDSMRQNLLEEQQIVEEMHDALLQKQFIPYLQPIFDLNTLQPVSAEVLVRWKHPQRGLVPPGVFVPLFERNGFITKLDFAIWEQACQLLHKWKAQGMPLVPISINISRIDLYHPRICDDLLELLTKYDLDVSLLKLEITESAYIDDQDVLPPVLRRFREAGFQILMDDFGSGYSSLNTLKDMPVNIMKIDMCFLAELEGSPRAASILTSVIRMAKWLDMPVVAEGVEMKAQLDFLHSIGCDMGQGYYFSKPLPVEEFERLLQNMGTGTVLYQGRDMEGMDLDTLWKSFNEVNHLFSNEIGGMAVFEITGSELKAQRVSSVYYQVTGCTPEQLFQTDGSALNHVHPEDRPLLMDACSRAAITGRLETVDMRRVNMENPAHRLSYRIRHLDTAGDCSVFVFIVNDHEPSLDDMPAIEQQYRKVFLSETLFVFLLQPGAKRWETLHEAMDARERYHTYTRYLRMEEGYIHPDDWDPWKTALSPKILEMLGETTELRMQARILDRSMNWVWVELHFQKMEANDPTTPQVLLYVKEVDRQRRTEDELRSRAETDAVSNLYNRGAIEARITERMRTRTEEAHAFFLIDIDNLKQVNDTLGHPVGDEAIQSIARVLHKQFRSTDLTGRFGGDEFVAFMSYQLSEDTHAVRNKAERVMEAVSQIVLPGHTDIQLTISVGIAIALMDGMTCEELYQNADKALYAVKRNGKNQCSLYGDLALMKKEEPSI